MIDASKVDDNEAFLIAHQIAKKVSEELTFPGEIRVTVLRETSASTRPVRRGARRASRTA